MNERRKKKNDIRFMKTMGEGLRKREGMCEGTRREKEAR